jgi:hypothetical protein
MGETIMNLIVHLRIVGILLLALALLNTRLSKHFGWREELVRVSLLTRQVFEVHSFFIIFVLAMMGAVAAFFPDALVERTQLAGIVALGALAFWTARFLFQFFVYDPRLWRGDRFRTAAHVFFSVLWAYFVLVFGVLLRAQARGGW